MDVRAGDAIIAHRDRATAGDGALVALDGTALATRFRAWRGASERRYVTTVYRVEPASDGLGLPDFDACVLVPVRLEGATVRPLAIVAIERDGDRRVAIADALARGVDAWHVHLLAADRPARAMVVADLAARHVMLPARAGLAERHALSA